MSLDLAEFYISKISFKLPKIEIGEDQSVITGFATINGKSF